MKRVLLELLLIIISGCVGVEGCERLPAPRSPQQLVARVRVLTEETEWSALYDLLSDRQKENVNRVAFRIGFKSQRVPPPYDYLVVDVIQKGSCDGCFPEPGDPSRALVIYSYSEPNKPRYEARVLVLREGEEWHVDGPME